MFVRASIALAVLAVVVSGGAFAGNGPRRISVEKRWGQISATFSYLDWTRVRPNPSAYSGLRLVVRRAGRVVLAHDILTPCYEWVCEASLWTYATWWPPKEGAQVLRRFSDGHTTAVVVDLYSGWAHCCFVSYIGVADGNKWHWIAHDWGNVGYRGERHDGRYYFVSGDNRFALRVHVIRRFVVSRADLVD